MPRAPYSSRGTASGSSRRTTSGSSGPAASRSSTTTRLLIVGIAAALALGLWLLLPGRDSQPPADSGERATTPLRGPGRIVFRDGKWVRMEAGGLRDALRELGNRRPGLIRVSGTVMDSELGQPVPDAEVVFASEGGESSAIAGKDGTYTIEIPSGFYRAFARADGYVAVGSPQLERLPVSPDASMAGVPRGELAPLLAVFSDQQGVDMLLRRGARIVGTVYDSAGRPVVGALVSGRVGFANRLILGTDMDETDLDGSFQLDVPADLVTLEATHAEFAGLSEPQALLLGPGDVVEVSLTMQAGCIIDGRVVDSRGQPVGEGSLEMWNQGTPPNDYEPVGRIDPSGRFRLARAAIDTIRLRAWPWKSPPTVPKDLSCTEGTRYRDITFVVPDANPDLEGSVWSASGQPMSSAYIDISPLQPGGMAQQERADAYGEWAFYSLPPGRYQLSAYVPGQGAAATIVTSPGRGIRLTLSGTGTIQGRANGMETGSFLFVLEGCLVRNPDGSAARLDEIAMPRSERMVTVQSGVFYIEDLPACELEAVIRMPNRTELVTVTVEPGRTIPLELDLRAPQPRQVMGVVLDADRIPVEGARVMRMPGPGAPREPRGVLTDAEGRYTIQAFTGDTLYFMSHAGRASAEVSWDSQEQRLDVTLEP